MSTWNLYIVCIEHIDVYHKFVQIDKNVEDDENEYCVINCIWNIGFCC